MPITGQHSRRLFLRTLAMGGALVAAETAAGPLRFLKPTDVPNPLAGYPNRDWEKTYRDIFKVDSKFTFLCAPNDTHNCLLEAHVKNGIIVRIGPTFGYGKAEDLYGNRSSHRWDPRICQKGLALVRRIYGDRRVKAPMVRQGFKNWVDAGFPRDPATGKAPPEYMQRGKDKWIRVSWDEAFDYSARALENIARTYSGAEGRERLLAQGYDPSMVEATAGAGTQTIKVRGGMALLGATRIYGLYRFANMLALADAKLRNVGEADAKGARGWDSYSWHTDLPPGHPMVTGAQTNDFELFSVEHSKLCVVWGMNWITTKMPDSHWLTEARLKGTKLVVVTVEYSATATKADEVIVIKPGTDPALALGLAQVLLDKKLYDRRWVETNTDLPFLVRMDTLAPLRPEELDPPLSAARSNPTSLDWIGPDDEPSDPLEQKWQFAASSLKQDLARYVVWDQRTNKLVAVTRDEVGPKARTMSPKLEGSLEVKLASGQTVEVRPHFELLKNYLDANMTPAQVSQITGAPESAITSLATQIAANPEKTSIAVGMGPNQFFNSDLKDRAILLVAALTRNLGYPGGNVGSYSGNYRSALIGGIPYYVAEDPFSLQLDPDSHDVKKAKHSPYESLHYYNYGDRPLRVAGHLFTGKGHIPTPTKAMWLSNSNSVLGNVKWHYDVVNNTLPNIEFVAFADWWWTASCEYADVVFAADSWAEFQYPDMTASCTNPFVQIFPVSPIQRVFDTRADIEILAGVAKALAKRLDEPRLAQAWHFVDERRVEVYLQRIIDHSFSLKGYDIETLHQLAKRGVPALVNVRTYPRASSYEQQKGEQVWHTKSGRLEFYRFEPEFVDSGENLVVYREPIDSTHREPNVIVAADHPALRPKQPEAYGIDRADLSPETRQVRHVMLTVPALVASQHPLAAQGYGYVYHTPKYRHGAHTTPVDTDFCAVLFGPFGDVYRRDQRLPAVTEGYVDMHPADAKSLGLEDGDYVYVDADPSDRPFRNWKTGTEEYKVARLMLRVRYYPGTPRGVTRTWHNMYGATVGSVRAHESRADGLAKSEGTNYQAMYRYGSHQSTTRAWLKPTLMTETLVHKDNFGQELIKGFTADVHCPVGASREGKVKFTKADDGGFANRRLFRPAELGLRPTYERDGMKTYLAGGFIRIQGK